MLLLVGGKGQEKSGLRDKHFLCLFLSRIDKQGNVIELQSFRTAVRTI